jgi:peptide deformylase
MSDVLTIDTGANLGTKDTNLIQPLPLYDENHPMLRTRVPDYEQDLPNHNMTTLVARLKMTMKLYGGIGLSANQCGVLQRVFVIGTDDFQLVCINPKILGVSDETVKSEEGCLSFPGLQLKLDRPSSIDVEFTDENGAVNRTRLDGITARCFQHELDHMNGIRFVDHMKPLALQMARQKQQKMIKKFVRNQKKK